MPSPSPNELPVAVQIVSSLAASVAAVVIPIILAVVGNKYTRSLKERETRAKFVELALDQLKTPPTPENENIRKWAIEVVNQYSGVALNAAAKKDLESKVGLVGPTELEVAGSNTIERQVYSHVASAGKQLGMITNILLSLARAEPPSSVEFAKLQDIAQQIEAIKEHERAKQYEKERRAAGEPTADELLSHVRQ